MTAFFGRQPTRAISVAKSHNIWNSNDPLQQHKGCERIRFLGSAKDVQQFPKTLDKGDA
jgi:hypothetical protein